ncbi:outer membrane beta-barrel protein [Parahaliea aestuarii]|uniref:Outer membrane beta-barrel protein n=1 Tax=Parahaliea aestuarii TaxID=1852021 RepID=A0A5C8ZRP2_9GAMM|nr:outer membrane beta-barrel protein [Parahaliea aestuarii]TXS90474.1 outer membrane beta-barrel protein [Parahaliea aestuarii]
MPHQHAHTAPGRVTRRGERIARRRQLCAALALGCVSATATSQDGDGKWYYGPLSVAPALRAELAWDDNLFFTPDDTVSTRILRINPVVDGEYALAGQTYTLGYRGDYGRVQESSDDNYEDHTFSAGMNLDLARRHKLALDADLSLKHQGRGEGMTQGIDPDTGEIPGFDPDGEPVTEPDRFNVSSFGGDYFFGARDSGNRLKLSARARSTEYRNHRDRTRFRDHDNYQAGLTFYHQLMPATSLLLEVRGNELSYAETFAGTASLDSRETRYLIGATWDISGVTRGTVKVGSVEKNFSDAARDDFSGLDWEVDVLWLPRSYSEFQLNASRTEQETFGEGDFIDTMIYTLGWNHGWRENLQSSVSVSYTEQDYIGIDRQQDIIDYRLSLTYQWRRWLAFELGADIADSDSEVDWLMYDKNVIRVGATFSL